MTIDKKMNGSTLEIALTGRLDTMTAPELEEALSSSMADAQSLKFDFSRLDYISSAGLRVLLSAHKAMLPREGMTICHVNDIVMEVFDVTGFSDILNIE